MAARMKCLALRCGHKFIVPGGKDGHHFLAHNLKQDVMFRVHVERRNAARRRQEDECLPVQHRPGLPLDQRCQFHERIVQQRAIAGVALNILQHGPTAVGLYRADRLAQCQAIGGRIFRPHAQRQPA